jgi:TRAP-type C4-dicarboxylate transport system permease small subunit
MIDRIVDRAAGAVVTLLGLVFIGAVCLNFANVVGRYAFGRAIFGADEVQTYIMVWMAFVGAAAVTWRNAHLRMDVLVTSLPARLQAALRLVELALMIATALFVLVQSWRYVGQMAAMGRRSDAAEIPMAVPHAAVAVGFGLIAAIALWRLVRIRADARRGAAGPPT